MPSIRVSFVLHGLPVGTLPQARILGHLHDALDPVLTSFEAAHEGITLDAITTNEVRGPKATASEPASEPVPLHPRGKPAA